MSCDLLSLATPGVAGLQPYQPGKPVATLQRELGLNEIIKLASNENPSGPSQHVLAVIAATKDVSRYPDGSGFDLKQALAAKHKVDPDHITLGNGSNDILEMVARAFVTNQHQVIYAQHAFAVYPLVTQAVGAAHIVIPAQDWGHDLPAMQAAVNDKTRLIFIANPNNPTGTWVTSQSLRNLLENVPEQVIVVVDEAYFEFACRAEHYPDSSLWLHEFNNLVVTRTFSKAYGLAGLRIGYALSHPDIADLLNRVRQPFNNNSVALAAAITALQDAEYIAHSVAVNQAGMKQLITAFDTMGLTYIPSAGNFICVDCGRPANAIYQALLSVGVIVRPTTSYGMPNHLRISIGRASENTRFINELATIMAT